MHICHFTKVNKAVEKWLFLFCLWVGFEGSGKTKCATCAAAIKLFFKMCGGKKFLKQKRWLVVKGDVMSVLFVLKMFN